MSNYQFDNVLPFVFNDCEGDITDGIGDITDGIGDAIINGTGNIILGEIKGEGSGVLSKFSESINPACVNRRILSKYGWTSTKTRTTGFKSCQIKR